MTLRRLRKQYRLQITVAISPSKLRFLSNFGVPMKISDVNWVPAPLFQAKFHLRSRISSILGQL